MTPWPVKVYYALLLCACLLGCATTEPVIKPEVRTIVKIERVALTIPSDLLEIPEQVPNLPLEVIKSDDKAVAKWLLDSEERTLTLEAKLRRLRELYITHLREVRAANVKEGVSPARAASAP